MFQGVGHKENMHFLMFTRHTTGGAESAPQVGEKERRGGHRCCSGKLGVHEMPKAVAKRYEVSRSQHIEISSQSRRGSKSGHCTSKGREPSKEKIEAGPDSEGNKLLRPQSNHPIAAEVRRRA